MNLKHFDYDSKMDETCVQICDALNSLPSCKTIESCNGHFKYTYSIWLQTDSLYSMSVITRALSKRYSNLHNSWIVEQETNDVETEPQFSLRLHSVFPYTSMKQMEEDIEEIIKNLKYWADDKYKSYFKYDGEKDSNFDITVKSISDKIRDEIKAEVPLYESTPKIAVIVVGEDPASKVYVRNKEKACEKVGMLSETYKLPSETTESEINDLIKKLNEDKTVTSILVQLPLPGHLKGSEKRILNKIKKEKDIDGFTDGNQSKLWCNKFKGEYFYAPCTPLGVVEIFKRINYNVTGKHIVIIGRSDTVGKPLAKMLLDMDATVSVCHSKTKNLKDITLTADVIISAVGQPKLITEDMVKYNTVVIDVGINRINGKLCGDVDYENVAPKCSFITPVPGGVGLMTVTMLLKKALEMNTCKEILV